MTSLPPLVEPVPALSEDERARTVRQTLLPEFGEIGQRRLAAARVAVVGAGGLGAPVLQYLAGAGVGSIAIIDDDVVEVSNLHRQVIHGREDQGASKAQNAARHVLGINPGARVQVHQVRLDESNAADLLGGADLVLDGTDTFPTRYLVADTCAELGIPLVWASVLRFDAQVSVFWSAPPAPASPVVLRDLFPNPPEPGTVPSCAEAGVIGSLCGIAGSIMATEAIKLITGMGDVLLGRVAVVDALSMRIHEVPLEPVASGADDDEPAASDAGPLPPAAGDHLRVGLGTVPSAARTMLDVAAFEERRAGAGDSPVVLVDVREPGEAGQDCLPGAVNLPISVLLQAGRGTGNGTALAELLADAGVAPEADLVTYCSAGVRAARATRLFAGAGWRSAVLAPEAVEHLREQAGTS